MTLTGKRLNYFCFHDDGLGTDYRHEYEVVLDPLNDYHNGYVIKPYLRSLRSMTEEEKKEMNEKLSPTGTAIYKEEGISTPLNHYGEWIPYEYMSRIIGWLNAHHFDYRGLIEKGLAIEVNEENNPYKKED